MSNAFKSVFPDSKIKYCLWHFERNLEINKNKICYKEVNENKDIFILYKCINIEDTTNNCCESYNHHLYSYFNKKPTFYKLLFILREEENYMKIEEEKL